MPGFDGTGPLGLGPRTGGGRGFCPPWIGPTFFRGFYWGYPRFFGWGYPFVRGVGRGGIPWGGGRGRAFGGGRGWWWRGFWGYPY